MEADAEAQSLQDRRLHERVSELPTLHPATLNALEAEAEEYVLAHITESNPLQYIKSLFNSWYKEGSPLVSPHGLSASAHGVPLSSPLQTSPNEARTQFRMSWMAVLSTLVLKFLLLFAKPIEYFGNRFEYHFNLLYLNHGLMRTLYTCLFNRAALRWPCKEDEDYYTVTGLVDPRQDLQIKEGILDNSSELETDEGLKSMANVCVMASKIAYENEKVIKKAVEQEWKMNFVQFYNCWNDYLESNATQGFIFTDKKEDANIIVVAFRGTQLFNMIDWCTDFDFSYYVLPEVGRVHVGFLEALGLGSRLRKETLNQAKVNAYMKAKKMNPKGSPCSGLSENVRKDACKVLAYDAMSAKVSLLLAQNPAAKLYITGHSLGGALATLFAALLFIEENDACSSLGGIFTFGQPRVGDATFATYMQKKFNTSRRRYFRVVYRTDIVPRVPFDDVIFNFKHISPCHYYTSLLESKALDEEPYKSPFMVIFLPMPHVHALKELYKSLRSRFGGSGEGYVETGLSMMVRFGAMVLPGVCSHFPSNYVEAVRGAPSSFLLQTGSFEKRSCESFRSAMSSYVFTLPKLLGWSSSSSTHEHVQ